MAAELKYLRGAVACHIGWGTDDRVVGSYTTVDTTIESTQ